MPISKEIQNSGIYTWPQKAWRQTGRQGKAVWPGEKSWAVKSYREQVGCKMNRENIKSNYQLSVTSLKKYISCIPTITTRWSKIKEEIHPLTTIFFAINLFHLSVSDFVSQTNTCTVHVFDVIFCYFLFYICLLLLFCWMFCSVFTCI